MVWVGRPSRLRERTCWSPRQEPTLKATVVHGKGFFLACCSAIGNCMLYKISVLLVGLKEGWERVKLVSGRPVSG